MGRDLGHMSFNVHRRAIRTDRSKYLWRSDGDHQLFDLADDPSEAINLVDARVDLAKELGARLNQWRSSLPEYVRKKQRYDAQPIDQQAIDRLRGLGYLGD